VKSKTLAVLITILALSAPALGSGASKKGEGDVWAVSFVRLLVEPSKYEGRVLVVAGYLGKDMNFYLTKDHADAFDFTSSLLISDGNEGEIRHSTCTGSFVEITGEFVQFDPGMFGLRKISKVFQPSRAKYCFGNADSR